MQLTLVVALALVPSALCGYFGRLKGTGKGLTPEEKQYILCEHNKIRSAIAAGNWEKTLPYLGADQKQPSAQNMQALCWCDELEEKAQKHASDCTGPPHDKRAGRSSANINDVGQNMMQSSPVAVLDQAMDAFGEEGNGYVYQGKTCIAAKAGKAHVCGHFTALTWAHTQCIACGYDKCSGHDFGRLVCNYGPGGNIQGEANYEEGTPCHDCYNGESCTDNLCANCTAYTCSDSVTKAEYDPNAVKDTTTQCAAYRDQLGVCNKGNMYYAWAAKNCPVTCGITGGIDQSICNKKYGLGDGFCKKFDPDFDATCVEGSGEHFAGKKWTTTKSGYACKPWDSQVKYHNFYFPDRSTKQAGNYCRNPGNSGSKPWCYVAEGAGWEYCDIPAC